VDNLKNIDIGYEALVDRHLEYYFSSKVNRQTLLKAKVVNRKNEIIDRSACKTIKNNQLKLANSFRLKANKTQNNRYSSLKPKPQSPSKTIGKKEF
jgi:hypothetical protein